MRRYIMTTICLVFSNSVTADTICMQDGDSGYQCFPREFVYASEELVQPMVKKSEENRKQRSISDSDDIYNRTLMMAEKLRRHSTINRNNNEE